MCASLELETGLSGLSNQSTSLDMETSIRGPRVLIRSSDREIGG